METAAAGHLHAFASVQEEAGSVGPAPGVQRMAIKPLSPAGDTLTAVAGGIAGFQAYPEAVLGHNPHHVAVDHGVAKLNIAAAVQEDADALEIVGRDFFPVGALEDGALEVYGESLAADYDSGLLRRRRPTVDSLLQGRAGRDHRPALGEEDPAWVRGLAYSYFEPREEDDRDYTEVAGRSDHGGEDRASLRMSHWPDGNWFLCRVD